MKSNLYPFLFAFLAVLAADTQSFGTLRCSVQDPRGGAIAGADLKLAAKKVDAGLRAKPDDTGL